MTKTVIRLTTALLVGGTVVVAGAGTASARQADFGNVISCVSGDGYWTCHQGGTTWYTDNPDWTP